jgi:hypothetical protein
LGDPAGEFTKALDLDFDASAFFGNNRSKRYALVIEDGKVKSAHVEPDNTGTDRMSPWLCTAVCFYPPCTNMMIMILTAFTYSVAGQQGPLSQWRQNGMTDYRAKSWPFAPTKLMTDNGRWKTG